MATSEEISQFVQETTGAKEVNAETDIWNDLGVVGDDFHELIEKYSKNYNVDMSEYLWYFHGDEEGHNLFSFIFKPPYERVQRIPVTPTLLSEFSVTGKWKINYPEHELPKRRWDLILGGILFFCGLTYLLLYLLN